MLWPPSVSVTWEVVSDEDVRLQRGRLEPDKAAWQERLAEIGPQIEDAELSGRAAEAVADTLAGVNAEDLDLQQRRWLLTRLDFSMTVVCEDWGAKPADRRYEVTSRWAGEALLGRDYVRNSKARAM